MAFSEQFLHAEDMHPIDIVESLAEFRDWEFDRVTDDQIAMQIEGQWRTYSITLAWSGYDDTLRLICTFDMDPPKDRLPALYETLNRTNDMCWTGSFSFWDQQRLMVYRYGLALCPDSAATPAQIDRLLTDAVASAERFYPAFQLVSWGNRNGKDALEVAIAQAYGRA